jgi:hypothetical protein
MQFPEVDCGYMLLRVPALYIEAQRLTRLTAAAKKE